MSKIRVDAYIYLYQELWYNFFRREYKTDISLKDPKPLSEAIWHQKEKDKNYTVTNKILAGTGIENKSFFYRKYIETKSKNSESYTEIDGLVLCKAIIYMGFKLPEELENQFSLKKKMEYLIPIFFGQRFPSVRVVIDNNDTISTSPLLPANDDTNEARATIFDFYEKIGSGEYLYAWNLMSEEFRNRYPWLGDSNKFIEGYTNLRGINNVEAFKFSRVQPKVIECEVIYDEEILSHSSPDLSSFSSMTVGNIKAFQKALSSIKSKIESVGGKNFEKIEMYKLFEPAASEYIWYRCGIKPDEISDIFPVLKTISVKRFYKIKFKLVDNKWYIESIRGIPTQSSR